jgi:hypothetical protein
LIPKVKNQPKCPSTTEWIVWHRWLTPAILATQEAEIRKISFRSQPQANSSQDPISEKKKKTMI